MWPQKEWFADLLSSSGGCDSQITHAVESTCSASRLEVSQGSGVTEASHLGPIQKLILSQAFLGRLQILYQQTFGSPSHSPTRESGPGSFIVVVEGTLLLARPLSKLPEFFLYIWKDLKRSVLAIKVCRSSFNDAFILYVMDIDTNTVVSQMINSFERSFTPREIKPPDWSLSLVLKSFTCLPYWSLKLSSNKHLAWNTCFLLALALAIQINE